MSEETKKKLVKIGKSAAMILAGAVVGIGVFLGIGLLRKNGTDGGSEGDNS
jgi:hypothetical protein